MDKGGVIISEKIEPFETLNKKSIYFFIIVLFKKNDTILLLPTSIKHSRRLLQLKPDSDTMNMIGNYIHSAIEPAENIHEAHLDGISIVQAVLFI